VIGFARIPLEQLLAGWWGRIDPALRRAFFIVAGVSLLAFGFEMTNLTLHHDDLNHLMVQKPLVGYYLGRFLHAGFFYYVLQGQFAPFLHMAVGLALMALYGLLVAHYWGARRTLDLALVASILCVFPYMANVYQYNSVMIAYPLAHLLAAGAVVLASRARALSTAVAALLFFAAFSIYQAVLANAATIFLVWLLARIASGDRIDAAALRPLAAGALAALVAVTVGGILHVLAVSSFDIPFDSAQGADKAFSLRSRLHDGLQLALAAAEVLRGSRAFFAWPEAYLPQPIKALHALLLAGAAGACLLLARGPIAKVAALALLGLAVFSPRVMQLLHPHGNFHSLTLTAYALLFAAAALLLLRSGRTLARNASAVAVVLLLAGYVAQCNWISTVNYLNTMAHYATLTQVLARLRALPDPGWDGRTVAVVGSYDMPSAFPFRPATGVASEFMTAKHMNLLARLMRDEVRFVRADASLPDVLDYAARHEPWPSPHSVAVVAGKAVVVLGRQAAPGATGDGEEEAAKP
jgi:hypothetical protein